MAIFYEHIKGCGAGTTGEDKVKDVWTWLEWPKTDSVKDRVYIYTNTSNQKPSTYIGYFITSDSQSEQTISSRLIFTNDVRGKKEDKSNTTNLKLTGTITVQSELGDENPAKFKVGETTTITEEKITTTGDIILQSNGNISVESGNITVDKGKCEALYFNATSDRRAKTNITPATFSALSVVNNLPIYTFNYKFDANNLTVGLIAQEAAQYDLDGFNMVDNLDATGIDNDMMQMKESKLVYVLWKAVQELSDQVDALKTEIHNLKQTK